MFAEVARICSLPLLAIRPHACLLTVRWSPAALHERAVEVEVLIPLQAIFGT